MLHHFLGRSTILAEGPPPPRGSASKKWLATGYDPETLIRQHGRRRMIQVGADPCHQPRTEAPIAWDRWPPRWTRWGCLYTRIPACDGKTAEADTPRPRDRSPRGPLGRCSPPRAPCSVSHLRVWHHILSSSQDYALVLEDDMRLAPDLAALARDTRWFPRGTRP